MPSSSKRELFDIDGLPVSVTANPESKSESDGGIILWHDPDPKTIKKGLYNFNSHVIETDGKIPDPREMSSIVVYYASWCGHCRHYAPIYKKIAEKHLDIKFLAVNCALYGNVCNKKKIHRYPTVIAYGFGEDITREGKSVKHSENQVLQYIRANKYKINKNKFSMNKLENTDDTKKWLSDARHKVEKNLEDGVTSLDRLHEGLASLDFMLEYDTVVGNAGNGGDGIDGINALRYFLKDVIGVVLPVVEKIPEQINIKSYFALETHLNGLASGVRGNIDSWDKALTTFGFMRDTIRTGHEWRICQGISKSMNSNFNLRGASASYVASGPLLGNIASTAYTCGFWQMFHILLANSQRPPEETMQTIHNTVKFLFGCQNCREHFLKDWNACNHGRCDVSNRKQSVLWLWRLHNSVTERVVKEMMTNGGDDNDNLMYFPPKYACQTCYDTKNEWNIEEVHKFLENKFTL